MDDAPRIAAPLEAVLAAQEIGVPLSSSLLQTKFFVPRRRRGLVSRARLIDRLRQAASDVGLVLVSAPAGFGKTTLLADWLTDVSADRPTTWLSLDAGDNDPTVFWTYLIAALSRALPALGVRAVALLESANTPIEHVVTALVNDLAELPNDVILVLDDYHAVDAMAVHEGMSFLLDHLPGQLHLVIGTRADPPFPLARFRATGRLVEIRAADLRFTPAEAADYLNGAMGLNLSPTDVAALEGRTEGWIAALQLAAISLQGRDGPAIFIRGFAGGDRYVVDYLMEEVLQRQPDDVRAFLIETSLVDRLTGSLCDAVTGQRDGTSMLEALDRGNLFLVRLDDQRMWYRYHHLFGDVLRARMLDEQPDRVPDLHRRASRWYEQNGEPSEAIRHALAAGDFDRAADLVELAVPAMRQMRQEATVLGWLQALPTAVVQRRPVLSVHYAGTLLLAGQLEGVDVRLRDAERWLDAGAGSRQPTDGPEMIVVDQEEYAALPSGIATYRAASALFAADIAGTMKYARLALDLAPEGDHLRHGSAAGLLALAFWWNGDLEAAHRWYSECLASLLKAGHVSDSLGVAISLADIRLAQGRLGEAMRTYEQALQRADAHEGSVLRGTADMHVGMSEVLRERNDLTSAMRHLMKSQELGDFTGLEQNRYRWRVAMARMAEAEGDPGRALDLLDEAGRQHVSDFLPNVRPVTAMKARVWVGQGKLAEAQAWAREHGVSAEDDLDYLREFEHITLARVLLAQAKRDLHGGSLVAATGLLDRLLRAAETGQRMRSVIEILLLQTLAHHAEADIPAALVPLERALTIAEPEGYVRLFTDEGPAMLALLEATARRRIAPNYLPQLLESFGKRDDRTFRNRGLVEPLSERELDVLRLLGSDLDGPAIANELSISLNTLRTHTKNIFAKLGVNSRRAAVTRAAELDVLSAARDR